MTTKIEDLDAFLQENRDSREYKRALAVKLALKGYMYAFICDLLDVTPSFVSEWKKAYLQHGTDGLLLKYTGAKRLLSREERQSVISWIQAQTESTVEQLKTYIEDTYHVVFQSRQSYYELLAAAKMSWKKAQRINPQKDPEQVAAKKKESTDYLQEHRDAIAAGDLIVLFMDECHLVWDDAREYVWGKTGERVEIPMKNYRERQTYYGAIDYSTGEVTVHPYPAGNGAYTVVFIKFLRGKYPGKRLTRIWDGATYHKQGEMPVYLAGINEGLDADAWGVTCLILAPHAPEQNPIEDIWLKAKQYVRKHWWLCDRFKKVKELFLEAIENQFFDFQKLHMYG